MIEVKPFKAADMLWLLEHVSKEIGIKVVPDDEIRANAKQREDAGRSITGWADGVIVGCAGTELLWPGVANVWLMVTPYINTHPKEGFRCIRQGLKKMISENNLHRIESFGRCDFPECHTLFKHLNFKVEGLKRKYTPDAADCIMYAIVR